MGRRGVVLLADWIWVDEIVRLGAISELTTVSNEQRNLADLLLTTIASIEIVFIYNRMYMIYPYLVSF